MYYCMQFNYVHNCPAGIRPSKETISCNGDYSLKNLIDPKVLNSSRSHWTGLMGVHWCRLGAYPTDLCHCPSSSVWNDRAIYLPVYGLAVNIRFGLYVLFILV